MFHDIPRAMLDRMHELERADTADRADGTPRSLRLRQVPPDTGRMLALWAVGSPAGAWIEIGTSAGYSTMWLALAARATGRSVETFELAPHKVELARATFAATGVQDVVTLIDGDFLAQAPQLGPVAFCFLDAEKEIYASCYDAVVPKLVSGGLLIADNVISHRDELQALVESASADPRVDAVVVPIGSGTLVCRKL